MLLIHHLLRFEDIYRLTGYKRVHKSTNYVVEPYVRGNYKDRLVRVSSSAGEIFSKRYRERWRVSIKTTV